jgi:hypothetical protein
MKVPGSVRSIASAAVAMSLATSSIASAAPAVSRPTNPLVTLSVFGSAQSRDALCAAGSAAAAAAGTAIAAQAAQPAPGCVLPIADAAPPPPLAESAVLPEAAPAAPYVAAAGAPNLWPLLVGLGLFSAAFFLLDDTLLDDGTDFVFPPLTPGSPT